jgi:ribonuclease HI
VPAGTNNIGELLGLLDAITSHQHVERLVVQADSRYAIDTYVSWMDGHAKRGWKTSTGSPTKNRDILEQLIAARDARRAAGLPAVVLEHVRGHSGHRLNGWADERAVRASEHAAKGEAARWSSQAQGALDVSVDAPTAAGDANRGPRKKR